MVKLYENKRASIGRTVYAITELDIDSLLNMNPPQSAFELQRAVLCLLASEIGVRLGSLLPLAQSDIDAVAGSPGLLLEDIHFEFFQNPSDHNSSEQICCKICNTDVSLSNSDKNPFHTLQTHHDTQHSLKFACRTCHQLISNAMKYQCIERQHNIVLAASLSLHYKKTGNDKISDILSIELSAPSIILPIQLPETPPQPTKEYDFFNELNLIPSNVFAWSVVDIEKFIKYLSNESIADKFKAEEIDGRSFMLMSETDFSELKLPLGPKLKILNAWKYLKSFAH